MGNTKTGIKSQNIKISPLFHRLLISVNLYSYDACCLKKCINTERSKGFFVRENLKEKHR